MSDVDFPCERDDPQLIIEEAYHLSHAQPEPPQRRQHLFIFKANRGFVDKYIEGKIGIAFRYRDAVLPADAPQYGFVVAALNGFHSKHIHSTAAEDQQAMKGGICKQQPLMLSDNIQVVQGPDGVIPSLIWLERFDSGTIFVRKPLFAFLVVQPAERIDHIEF